MGLGVVHCSGAGSSEVAIVRMIHCAPEHAAFGLRSAVAERERGTEMPEGDGTVPRSFGL